MLKKIVLLVVLCLATAQAYTAVAQSQQIKNLNQKQAEAQKIVEKLDEELKKISNSTKDAQKQLNLYTKRLEAKNTVLQTINDKIKILDKRNETQSLAAKKHSQRLEKMTAGYQKIVIQVQQLSMVVQGTHMAQNELQKTQYALQKQHLRTLLEIIQTEKNEIISLQGIIGNEIKEIQESKKTLDELIVQENIAKKEIIEQKNKIEKLQKQLGINTKQITQQKNEQLKQLEKIQQEIQKAIQEEINSKGTSNLTPQQIKALSDNFAKDKGKMNPPLNEAKISDQYGLHKHPTQPGVKIDNKGVNIKANANAAVKVVNNGVVSKIFVVAGGSTAILVRHGQYITVYANLKNVSVQNGQYITKGTTIGTVGQNGELHFEVWKETQTMNPTQWVKF